MVETFRNNKAPLPFGKRVGEIVHQPLDIGLAKQCRNFAHEQRGRAEALNPAAETLEIFGRSNEPSGSLGVKLDDFRDQQHLPGKPAGEGPLQTLIDEALMGRC